jgi:hypothetical protein
MHLVGLVKLVCFQAAVLGGLGLSVVHGDEQGETTRETAAKDAAPPKSKCGVYLAQSSIPGSGLGMFAGDRNYSEGDVVTLGDVVIPIIEQDWHTGGLNIDSPFLWDEYTWNGVVFNGAEEEGEAIGLIMFASPGVGSAANSYLSLVNIEDTYTKMSRGMSGDSPGAGAISPYHDRSFLAQEPISAGAELFVEYVMRETIAGEFYETANNQSNIVNLLVVAKLLLQLWGKLF